VREEERERIASCFHNEMPTIWEEKERADVNEMENEVETSPEQLSFSP
jgi:hypothetical protein